MYLTDKENTVLTHLILSLIALFPGSSNTSYK